MSMSNYYKKIFFVLIVLVNLHQLTFAASLNEEKAMEYLNLAVLFKESGEYSKAKEILRQACAYNQDKRISSYLARLEFLSGAPDEAARILNDLEEKDWVDFLYLGLAYEYLAMPDQAIDSYQNSIKIHRDNTIAFFRLGKIFRRKQEYSEASEYFLQVVNNDSSIRLAYYYLGECLVELEKYKEAYKYLAKAVNFYPANKEMHAELILTKEKMGGDFFVKKTAKQEELRNIVKFPGYLPDKMERSVQVGLVEGVGDFSFSCKNGFIIFDEQQRIKITGGKLYTVILRDKKIMLTDYKEITGKPYFSGGNCKITPLKEDDRFFPFYVLDVSYGEKDFWHKKIDRAYRGSLEVVLENNKLTLINRVGIEEYLYGVMSAEIPAKTDKEALKAQALAARTLAVKNLNRHRKQKFDFCVDVHCQTYHGLSAETPQTTEAVKETRGQIITFNDKPIEAFYHSNCGGCLCKDTFGECEYLNEQIDADKGFLPESPYEQENWFLNRPDVFCSHKTGSNFRWQRVYDKEDYLLAFGVNADSIKQILILEKGDCFHSRKIKLVSQASQKVFNSGLKIRNYFDKLRSSAFKLEIKLSPKAKSEMILFWGVGFGHGAGLCQEGASWMAKKGYSYRDILKHYYPGTKIKRIY